MKTTVTTSGFVNSFTGVYSDHFSYASRVALFKYLEEYEKECGVELELDPVLFCCDYREYENLAEFIKEYGEEYQSIDDVREVTEVIMVDDYRFIIGEF